MDDRSILARLRTIDSGTWRPLAGSLAAEVVRKHRNGRSHAEAQRHLRLLIRLGARRSLWWLAILEQPAEQVAPEDRDWVMFAWHELGAGRSPWPRSRPAA